MGNNSRNLGLVFMKKKRNWIKGLDRIAILMAIPIAILGFSYSFNAYSNKHSFKSKIQASLDAGYSKYEIYDYLKKTDKFTKDICYLEKEKHLSPDKVLDTLSKDKYSQKIVFFLVGIAEGSSFGLITILSIGFTTRIIPKILTWIKKGFMDV